MCGIAATGMINVAAPLLFPPTRVLVVTAQSLAAADLDRRSVITRE
jgi:hypothetical protein